MRLKLLAALLILSACAHAGIIEDVRTATGQNNFTLAESEVHAYKSQHGATPELAEAVSWMARIHWIFMSIAAAESIQRG